MIEAFYRLLHIAQEHRRRFSIEGIADTYWSGRCDEAAYWHEAIRNVLTPKEIELPAERLEALE